MSQTQSFHLPNLAGAPFRALLNQILAALADQNAGSTEPENPFAGMVWLDTRTETPVFKLRNAGNTAWVTIFTAQTPPSKSQVGLSRVPNYSATADLSDGSLSKFLLAAAGKALQDGKLDKGEQAYDSARLGGKLANTFAQISATYPNLRAQATTKADVGLGSVQNYGITSSLTSNNSKQYLSAKGGYDLNQKKVDKTVTVNGKPLSGNISLSFNDVGALAKTGGGDLGGLLNFTPDSGDVLQFDGITVLRRLTRNGGIAFGCDDALILGCGEARQTLQDNVSHSAEVVHVGSDGGISFYTNLESGWGNRRVFSFDSDGGFRPGNAARTRHHLQVLSQAEINKEIKRKARDVGEIVEFGFEEEHLPPGFFVMNGTRVVNGMLEPAYAVLRARCLGRYIHQSGNDFIVQDMPHFKRGQGSSGRGVGAYEGDAIKEYCGPHGRNEKRSLLWNNGIWCHACNQFTLDRRCWRRF